MVAQLWESFLGSIPELLVHYMYVCIAGQVLGRKSTIIVMYLISDSLNEMKSH